MREFINFVRSQGVVGLAVGFILGGAVSKVISSLVEDIINPLLSVVLGATDGLAHLVLTIGSIDVKYGHFLTVFIDFVVIAFVVYFVVTGLGLDRLDKKKS